MDEWQQRDFSKMQKLPITEGYPWNNSKEEVKRCVIFNWVGECGSPSVLNLLQSLAKNNHFYLISSQVYNEKSSAEYRVHSSTRDIFTLSTLQNTASSTLHTLSSREGSVIILFHKVWRRDKTGATVQQEFHRFLVNQWIMSSVAHNVYTCSTPWGAIQLGAIDDK